MPDPLDTEAIKARAAAANPGPWRVEVFNGGYAILDSVTSRGSMTFKADADFIAHARTDVPALVAELERLREVAGDEGLIAYNALQEFGAPVACPGCDGNGDDIRHEGTCTLCGGTGELTYHRLNELAARRKDGVGK